MLAKTGWSKNDMGRGSERGPRASQMAGSRSRRMASTPPMAVKKRRSLGLRGQKRRHLDERLQMLYQRAMMLEHEIMELEDNRFYRTCIFGSARIKTESKEYNDVFELARYMAWEGIDVLTGGGPGLMEAANKGAHHGRLERRTKSLSFGLSIELPHEVEPNLHLDIKRHHFKFSSRLDDFMRLSHSIICTPGGIGTMLEFFFSWQLLQVKHVHSRPIVLMDKSYWDGIIGWMRSQPLARGLVGEKDFDIISIVDGPSEAFEIISKHHGEFRSNNVRKGRKR